MTRDRLYFGMTLVSLTLAWSGVALAAPPDKRPAADAPEPAEPPPPPPAEAEPPPPPPPPPPPAHPGDPTEFLSLGGDWRFGFHGIAGVSAYIQDTPSFVLNGQGPLLPLSKPGSGLTTGADIRQSRFSFSLSGPRVLGATPKAVLEIDLFGLNSPGGYGEVSVYERVRLAYAELNWGSDILRFGQDHQLILGIIPESIGHMAYPATYWAGMIGWREPGIGYFHKIVFDDSSNLEFAAQVMKSDWENPADFGTPTTNDLDVDLGQLSGWLGVEGRIKYTSEHLTAFVSGHYNRVQGNHSQDVVAPTQMNAINRNWNVVAGVAAFKVVLGPLSLTGSGYVGQNLGPLLGEQLQFFTSNNVNEYGAWGQAKFAFTKEFDISALAGTSQLKSSDVEAAGGGRQANTVIGGMVRYKVAGFAFGPEYFHVIAKDIAADGSGAPSGAGAPRGLIAVNQGMFSGCYFF
jgi:hypothetical protein